MRGILALFGSGEFTDGVFPIDDYLLSNLKNPRVAIFPTAAGLEADYAKWIKMGEMHYGKLGVPAKGFNVIDTRSANSEEVGRDLESYNYFIFSGGDPGYLLETIKDSLVWKTVFAKYNSGSVLVGSSAGAMVLGRKVWGSIYKFDKEGTLLPWDAGLSVVEFGILPHFDQMASYFGAERTKKANNNLPQSIEIIGIDENTAYININGKWESRGQGKVHFEAKI